MTTLLFETVLLLWLAAAALYRISSLWAVARMTNRERNAGAGIDDRAYNSRATSRDSSAGDPAALLPGKIVLLRPLHGATAYVEECLAGLWRVAAEGGARVRLGLSDAADPALEVAERLRARWPAVDASVQIGEGPAGKNRKVANLIQATDDEDADILILSDADIMIPDDYIERVTEPLGDPQVGLSTCPYRSVADHGLASRINALITNTHFLPSTCLAVCLEPLHFALGATIAVRKTALEAAGGLEPLLGEAADDYHLGRNIEKAGYRLAWVPLILDHRLAREPVGRTVHRHLRWTRAIREARLGGYLGLAVTHGLVPAILLGIILPLQWSYAWLPSAGWLSLEACGLWSTRKVLGLRARDLLLVPVVDLFAFLLFLGGLVGHAQPPD